MEDQPLLGSDAPPKQTLQNRIRAILTPSFIKMMIYTVLYVFFGVINSLFLKKTMDKFVNYPFFLNQVTNYGYIPIFGIVVLYEFLFTKLITKEQRAFPFYKFLIMGSLDAVNGYFVVIGGVFTSGPMQQLLTQAIIPVTMVGSFIFLREKYSLIQIGGAALIIGGVVVSLLPSLQGGGLAGNKLFFNMFFLCQAIPFAASNLYKDIAFKSIDMDVWYLQFWDVVWQSLVGTMLFPINTILPEPATISWKSIPTKMRDGGMCMLGHDIIVPTNSSASCTYVVPLPPQDTPCDDCTSAYVTLLIYMAINVLYNVFILLIIKHGSATVLSIAQTIRLPLTNLCFSAKWIMGQSATQFNLSSVFGLLIILLGLTAYRAGSLLKNKREDEDGPGVSARILPRVGPGGAEVIVETVRPPPLIIPKTHYQQREMYFSRLGIAPKPRAIQ